jgi:3-oxoacyl-[acyl-carrier-protein] synthase-1
MTEAMAITGMGVLTPVGLSAPASFAALRAGVAGLREVETHKVDGEYFDKAPVVGGRVPTEWFSGGPVEWEWPGHERFGVVPPPAPERLVASGTTRLLELALPAAREALGQTAARGAADRLGLYLGVDYADKSDPLIDALVAKLGLTVDEANGLSAGRAAGLLALEAAVQDLQTQVVQIAVVGSVDSLIRTEALRRLEAKGTLRSGSNPQGAIPGEAAAFLVLETSETARRRKARPLAWVVASASAKEPTAGTEEPNHSVGLSEVLRRAREDAGLATRPLVICDLNGDRYRAIEWALANVRALGNLHGDADIWHPADCIGDSGAASGLLNVAWGATALQKRYARADRILVWGASDGKSRAAAVLAPAAA